MEDRTSHSSLAQEFPSRPHPEQASSQRRVPRGWKLHSAPSGRVYAWTRCPCILRGPRRRLRPTCRGLSLWSLCPSCPSSWTCRPSWPRSMRTLYRGRFPTQGPLLIRAAWRESRMYRRPFFFPTVTLIHKVSISSYIISLLLVQRGFYRGCVSYPGFAFCDNDYFSIFFHLFIFLFQRRRTLSSCRPAESAPRPGAPTHRWQGSFR